MIKTTLCYVLAAGALAAAGCGDDDTTSGTARIGATWSLALGGEPADCFLLGAHHVALAITPAGDGGAVRVACDDGEAISEPLPLGSYEVVASLLDFDGGAILSLPARTVTLDEDGATVGVSLAFAAPAARVAVTWELEHPDGSPADCADFDANRFELLLEHATTATLFAEVFDCDAGAGTSRQLPLGVYGAMPGLLTDFDVITTVADPFEVELDVADQVVAVDPVVFVLR
jgi:hypothetical protein